MVFPLSVANWVKFFDSFSGSPDKFCELPPLLQVKLTLVQVRCCNNKTCSALYGPGVSRALEAVVRSVSR